MNEHSDAHSNPGPDDLGTGNPAALAAAAELQTLQAERLRLEEQLHRAPADAANMRRRAQKEAEEARHRILEGITQELLPVLDNFELALQAWHEQGERADPNALVQGVRMVQTLLLSTLERHGLQEIAAAGQAFDPARHAALAVECKAGTPAGHVLRVLMKGYLLSDRVARHAKVIVSGEPPAGGPDAPK